MENEPLIFDLNIAKDKPNSYRKVRNNSRCPFCVPSELTDIYEQRGEMIWLHNKYPTLVDTVQTVLIETSNHEGDITNYSRESNRELLHFALECFNKMNSMKIFQSVLWYKNFGPQSGGSLVHPHMQLVGLKKQNGYRYVYPNNFTGVSLFRNDSLEVNVSTRPIHGYIELNMNLLAPSGIDLWADWIQKGAQYMLQVLSGGRCDSYNLFFYPRKKGRISAKLISRFFASPYFVGYKLSQVDNMEKLISEAQKFKQFFEDDSRLS